MSSEQKQCPWCKKRFSLVRLWQKFCSDACRNKAHREKKREGKQ